MDNFQHDRSYLECIFSFKNERIGADILFAMISNCVTMLSKSQMYTMYQFGWGILKMVGPKKQDFWPKFNTLKKLWCFLSTMKAASVKKCQNLTFKDVKNHLNHFIFVSTQINSLGAIFVKIIILKLFFLNHAHF